MLDSKPFIIAFTLVAFSAVLGQEHNTGSRPHAVCYDAICSDDSSQNLAVAVINGLSDQIKMEFDASHTYLAMAAYFGRDDVSYRGFAKFFMKASEEEREHGVKLVNYLNLRGGYPNIRAIGEPDAKWRGASPLPNVPATAGQDTAPNPVVAIQDALTLERKVNNALLDLHWIAQNDNDAHLADFLEAEFLSEQVDSIRELSGFLTVLKRLQNDPLGLHQLDEELFSGAR